MQRVRPLEIFLIQFIIYTVLWLISDFTATLVTLVFTAIFIFVFIIALISELIEPSKVPRWYFGFMIVSILAPIIAAVIFVGIMGADFDWTK